MKIFPSNFGTLHFTGIGGIGMSGVAELLHNMGYKVQGSDQSDSPNVQRLREQGIRIAIGHAAENIFDGEGKPVGGIVINALINEDNPEIVKARELKIPLINRSEVLAELMRAKWSVGIAGTHGKTTTTSIVSALLEAGGFDPTVMNGGIVNAYGTNTRIGKGDWMVAEADEAYGTFLKLHPTVAVVTNIDPEHLDYYQTFDNVRAAFKRYVEATPFYGFSVLCVDHPEVQKLAASVKDSRRVITYGTNRQAELRARNIRLTPKGGFFDVHVNGRLSPEPRVIANMHMPMPGQHNILNALAGIGVALQLGMADETIRQALASFSGVKRRFTFTGEANGITVIDDYGHHPVEVSAVLKAARSTVADDARVIAVFQPHRYSRVHDLYADFCTCFDEADTVLVADVYAAGEVPIKGAEKEDLVAGLTRSGHKNAKILRDESELAEIIHRIAKPGDIVICLGAGSITKWAYALPEQLAEKYQQAATA